MGARAVVHAPVLRQYVLKVHSRCDLACDHCYVYEHVDQSWRAQPKMMSPDTVAATAGRIAEHAARHGLETVYVVLHGGEPLLLGADGLRLVMQQLRAAIAPVARLDLRLQSNGVRLDQAVCDLLREHEATIGISLDGDRTANDRHRRYANGASSHAGVRRALQLLREPANRAVYGGLLCTIDLANDPVAVYEALLAEDPPRIELLLPHATWDTPPANPAGVPTPYADWLLTIHRRWTADGRPVPIRVFDALRSAARGGHSGAEAFGLDPADLVVVETDGSWEQADSLKTAFDGAPATGLTVFEHSVDQVAAHAGISIRQLGLAGLCEQCQSCTVVRECGGGLYAHRFRTGTGFANPSVYCADLEKLIVSTGGPGISAGTLDEIATGHIGTATADLLDQLAADLLEAILTELAERGGPARPDLAWSGLVELSQHAPDDVRAVLAHPFVRWWAAQRVRAGGPVPDAYLGNILMAAAVRAGRAVEAPVAVESGAVHLPTVGSAQAPAGGSTPTSAPAVVLAAYDGRGTLRIRHGGESVTVRLGEAASGPPLWSPARHVTVEGSDRDPPAAGVLLEDLDPHRDCHDWPALPRLDATAATDWERALTGAWRVIARDAPGHLPGLRRGLRVVTPLIEDPGGARRSATVRDAYGAVGAALAPAEDLAILLVHEFQHVKLGALLDHHELYHRGYQGLLSVGWRTDQRPVEAVLQGTYAHLAVAEMWRPRSATVFETYRGWAADAVEALLSCRALTPDGSRFVRRMGETLDGWAR